MWTTDHTNGRREAVDEHGEQPEGQPYGLAMTTGSKRPRVWLKRQRGRNGKGDKEKDRPDNAVKTLCT